MPYAKSAGAGRKTAHSLGLKNNGERGPQLCFPSELKTDEHAAAVKLLWKEKKRNKKTLKASKKKRKQQEELNVRRRKSAATEANKTNDMKKQKSLIGRHGGYTKMDVDAAWTRCFYADNIRTSIL